MSLSKTLNPKLPNAVRWDYIQGGCEDADRSHFHSFQRPEIHVELFWLEWNILVMPCRKSQSALRMKLNGLRFRHWPQVAGHQTSHWSASGIAENSSHPEAGPGEDVESLQALCASGWFCGRTDDNGVCSAATQNLKSLKSIVLLFFQGRTCKYLFVMFACIASDVRICFAFGVKLKRLTTDDTHLK